MTAHEAAARTRKAFRLAGVLAAQGATADEAAALPKTHRHIAAELAGCRPPSPETWATVVEIMRAGEAGIVRAS